MKEPDLHSYCDVSDVHHHVNWNSYAHVPPASGPSNKVLFCSVLDVFKMLSDLNWDM